MAEQREAVEQSGERDPHLEAGQCGADAEVGSGAEGEVSTQLGRRAVQAELVGSREDVGVAVRGAVAHHHPGPGGYRRPRQLRVGDRLPVETEDRWVVAQRLLDGGLHQGSVSEDGLPAGAILQEPPDEVGDARGRRLVAPDEQLDEH